MDQDSLNHYFESDDALLQAHHQDDLAAVDRIHDHHHANSAHAIESATHGPLDLLLDAISDSPGATRSSGDLNQDGSSRLSHNTPQTILPEGDSYTNYDEAESSTQNHHLNVNGRENGNHISQTNKDEGQAEHSIQGLLAASRMLGGGTNARAGSSRHVRPLHHTAPGTPVQDNSPLPPTASRRINPNPLKRRATSPPLSDIRRAKITRMFAATIGPSGSRVPEQQMSFSTITIMHGHIAQKSYGKEKRFLCPPPVVRMTGNISDTVDTTVFKLVNEDIGADIPVISNTQGVRLEIAERDLDARAHLREGISFPGLYASRTGKAKGLKLRLDVFQPGGTLPREPDPEPRATIDDLFDPDHVASHEDESQMFDLANLEDDEAGDNQSHLQATGNSSIANQGEGDGSVPEEIQEMIQQDPDIHRENGDRLSERVDQQKPHAENIQAFGIGELATDEDLSGIATGLVEDFNKFSIAERPWATFEASGIQIVSKPSKQTVGISKPSKNSRAIGIRIGDPFALWSRVSAQTVMTRYLYVDIDRGLLVGRNGDWSAWVMDVVSRGEPPQGHAQEFIPDPDVLTYGSTVVLRDIHTQYRSEPLLLCKVINGTVYLHDYGPVSELHRIAFAKIVPGQGRWYLRSPMIERVRDKRGPRVTAGKRNKKKKTKPDGFDPLTGALDPAMDDDGVMDQNSLVLYDQDSKLDPMMETGEDGSEVPNVSPALFSAPQIRSGEAENGGENLEYLDDYLTWTISGITEHSFTFFEGRHEIGDYSSVFKFPLTPMPEILDSPAYSIRDNTITIAVTNYYYDDDNVIYRGKPLYLYLGAIGPLRVRTYRSIAPDDNWTDGNKVSHRFPAVPTDGVDDLPPEARPYSSIPQNVEHTILVIDCPDPLDMWNATAIERERYERKQQGELLAYSNSHGQDGIDDEIYPLELPPYVRPGVEKKKMPKSRDMEGEVGHMGMVDDLNAGEGQAHELEMDVSDQHVHHHGEEETPLGDVDSQTLEGELHLQDQVQQEGEHHDQVSVNHFQQAEFQQHDLQQPNFTHDPDEHEDHGETEITREMVENLVRQAQMQEQVGDLSSYGSLNPFSSDGFNLDDQHQIALLASQAARAQVDTMLHNDMTYVHGVATDIGIFTARALEAAAHAAQSGSDMLDPQTILAQHQATLADATRIRSGSGLNSPHSQGEGSGVNGGDDESHLHLPSLADMSVDLGGLDVSPTQEEEGESDLEGGSSNRKGKRNAKDKKAKPKRETKAKGGPKKPRTVPPAPILLDSPLQAFRAPLVKITKRPFPGNFTAQGHVPRERQLGGSSLPLLFLRQSDNTGYHTGKNLVVNRSYLQTGAIWDIQIL